MGEEGPSRPGPGTSMLRAHMFPRPRFPHLVLVLLCLCLPLRSARAAEDFEHAFADAVRLYEGLEYEAALTRLEQARRLEHDPARDVQVSLHEGAMLANLGRWEAARRAFTAALSQDPRRRCSSCRPR